MLSRLSITVQFTIIGLLGLFLTISALGLSLNASYNLDLQAKKTELKSIVEAGVTTTEGFVALAQEGKMSTAQAQADAIAALSSARFGGGNYYFVDKYDGTNIVHVNKRLIGTNRLLSRDAYGNPTDATTLNAVLAGKTTFAHFYIPKAGSTIPQPKIGYMQGVPQWGWAIGSGIYVDDVWAEFLDRLYNLALIFMPLFLAVAIVVYLMRRSVSALLSEMTNNMERLAKGDLQTDIAGLGRKDDLGRMAQAVQVFKNAAIEKKALEEEMIMERAAAEAEREKVTREREEATRQLEFVIGSVATGLQNLSSGQLTYRLHETFATEYEKLRGDFNAAMETLQVTMQSIATTARGVRVGTSEVTQASDDLSRRTEQQAASLEETAAALDQITATVRRTAEVANEARDLVSTSKADAEHSGAVVRDTVQAMSGIETSSKQIGNIIGVIDEIAFQTNLLALNAGVEAARAGDAGRGFAVVATEVRALAQRSADAAKEIKVLISASGQQVESGVKLVSETGQALGRIVTQVTQLNGLVMELAASAKEQATGLGEVNAAVNQMDQVTQQNAAMVEQSTAASHNLSAEAEELARLVGQFRIGDEAAAKTTHAKSDQSASLRDAQTAKRFERKSKANVVALPPKNRTDRAF
ncbi:MAG TPA: methyl-accepting chemotaxis protein [Acidocella sp.]|jgi:methyl-accepting chemotaxis protein|nr:methyl-accepting chemotaxis protein [Acidocella sp.]